MRVKYDLNNPKIYNGFSMIARGVGGPKRFYRALDYFHKIGYTKLSYSGLHEVYRSALNRSKTLRIDEAKYNQAINAIHNKVHQNKVITSRKWNQRRRQKYNQAIDENKQLRQQINKLKATLKNKARMTKVGIGMNIHKQQFYLYAYVKPNQTRPEYALEDNGLGVKMTLNIKQRYSGKTEDPKQSYQNYVKQQSSLKDKRREKRLNKLRRDDAKRTGQLRSLQQNQQKRLQQQRTQRNNSQSRYPNTYPYTYTGNGYNMNQNQNQNQNRNYNYNQNQNYYSNNQSRR